MGIIKLNPIGYCKGVEFAINKAIEIANNNKGQNIYCINQIVHNDYVNNMLSNLNITILNGDKEKLIDSIDSGIVIFSAHGTSERIIKKAQDKNLTVINTICPWVKKVMDISKKYLDNNYDIIYIGKKNHPEAEAECSISNRIHLIETIEDLYKLNIQNDKIIITNQTTISINDLYDIYKEAKKIYPTIEEIDEICNSTRTRQEMIKKLDKSFDGLIVVGDKKSNNTKNLYNIGINSGFDTIMVENYREISNKWLENKNKIAITSGTSTPIYLVNEIIEKIEK